MHPEVQSDTPGVCPKCGMKLVPVKNEMKHMDNRVTSKTFPLPEGLRKLDPKLVEQKLKVQRHIIDAKINAPRSDVEISFHEDLISPDELMNLLQSKAFQKSELPLV